MERDRAYEADYERRHGQPPPGIFLSGGYTQTQIELPRDYTFVKVAIGIVAWLAAIYLLW